jgi:hypothetical protein
MIFIVGIHAQAKERGKLKNAKSIVTLTIDNCL